MVHILSSLCYISLTSYIYCAEVSDVANAIFDGSDAVMLSGESAMGADPVRTVQWMGKIIAEAEAHADDVSPSF